MPIANCIISPDCPQGAGNLIELWSAESGQSSEHITVNLIAGDQQLGVKCAVMANLLLPSMWSAQDISALQTGLARALAKYFSLPSSQVQVVTHIVDSGRVVEQGQEVSW